MTDAEDEDLQDRGEAVPQDRDGQAPPPAVDARPPVREEAVHSYPPPRRLRRRPPRRREEDQAAPRRALNHPDRCTLKGRNHGQGEACRRLEETPPPGPREGQGLIRQQEPLLP